MPSLVVPGQLVQLHVRKIRNPNILNGFPCVIGIFIPFKTNIIVNTINVTRAQQHRCGRLQEYYWITCKVTKNMAVRTFVKESL